MRFLWIRFIEHCVQYRELIIDLIGYCVNLINRRRYQQVSFTQRISELHHRLVQLRTLFEVLDTSLH